MSATSFREYVQNITNVLNASLALGNVGSVNIEIDQRSALRGFIKGLLLMAAGSEMHFREFIDVTLSEPRIIDAYHYQDREKTIVFRYDNALHRPLLPHPEHKHTRAGVSASRTPTLEEVVQEIAALL